jgi:hypothetical protein
MAERSEDHVVAIGSLNSYFGIFDRILDKLESGWDP